MPVIDKKTIQILCHGKFNPTLEILGKKPDGFYSLALTWHRLALHDVLTVSPRDDEDFVLRSDDPRVPQGEKSHKNNCILALELLKAEILSREPSRNLFGFDLHIEKNLPFSGGLGGSSTNASAALLAAMKLWKPSLDFQTLLKIAAQVGHDCPFFCTDYVHCIGGERDPEGVALKPLPALPPLHCVVACFPFAISAGEAYGGLKDVEEKLFSGDCGHFSRALESRLCCQSPTQEPWEFKNDLELSTQVQEKHKDLDSIKLMFIYQGAIASMMSGSGPSVMGFFHEKARAVEAAQAAECLFPKLKFVVTHTLSH